MGSALTTLSSGRHIDEPVNADIEAVCPANRNGQLPVDEPLPRAVELQQLN